MSEPERKLLIDSAAGVYIPRNFYERFDFPNWNLGDSSQYRELSHPDNPGYWEAWDDVLLNAVHIDNDGKVWVLWQDGDLFAVQSEVES